MDPGTCPQCGKKLVLINDDNNLYFGCPNLLDRKCNIQKKVDRALIRQVVLSLKLKCEKCRGGHMVFRDGRLGPFLGCDQYGISNCQAIMRFDDTPSD